MHEISVAVESAENFSRDLDDAGVRMLYLLESFSEKLMNKVPFENSWTAAEVGVHVTKSNASLVRALCLPGLPSNRNIGEKIPQLKGIFLNFTRKLKSPHFVLPIIQDYNKEQLTTDLKTSFELVQAIGQKVDLSETIAFPIFGQLTKWEVLHFTQYHTLRHIHQLKKIKASL